MQYETSNYTAGTLIEGKGKLLVFPYNDAGCSDAYTATGSSSITVNIDNLGDKNYYQTRSIANTYNYISSGIDCYDLFNGITDSQPQYFEFTTSIQASGFASAVLYLEIE